jgi:hypothetical protein
MIKDIVVNLNVGAEANWASDYAISVAAAFNAHLTGSVFLYARSYQHRAQVTFPQKSN